MTPTAAKKAVLERDKVCVDCGLTNDEHYTVFGRSLGAHRLQPKLGYQPENCVLLCIPCHCVRHGAKAVTANPLGICPGPEHGRPWRERRKNLQK